MMTSDLSGSGPTPHEDPTGPAAGAQVTVALVEAHGPTRERLQALLGSPATAFSTVEELAARLTGTVPVIMVLGPSCADDVTLGAAGRTSDRYPMLASILVVQSLSTDLLQRALRAGVRDVVELGGEPGALARSVQQLAAALAAAASGTAAQDTAAPETAAPETAAPDTAAPDAAPRDSLSERTARSSGQGTRTGSHSGGGDPTEPVDGQVLTVFSPKGGSGKSVLATSLAVALAQRSDRPVCLVDGDLQFGDVAVMLKLAPHHTIVDAVSALDRMDAPLLESLLVTHEPSGLRVLPAPLEPALADRVGAAEMVAVVETLRSFCSYVVVDTPAYFNDVVLGLVEVSDKVMLVAGMDIPNIKNLKIGLQTLRLLNTPTEKLMLVLNRANSKVRLDVGEVERTLQMEAAALIPSDVVVPRAVNRGEAVVLSAPRSGVSRAVEQLAEQFLPRPAPKRRR